MVTAQGERGDIILFHDFVGAELPVAGTGAYGAAGGTAASIGPFKITGQMAVNDSGTESIAIVNGALRLLSTNEDTEGITIGTEVIFSPALNGTLTMETRVQRAAITAGNFFAGFSDDNIDRKLTPCSGATTTISLVDSDLCGFIIDDDLSATADWHCVFNGGTTTGVTVSTDVVTGTSNSRNVNGAAVQTAVAGEYDLLRLDIFSNGRAEWRVNNVLVQSQANAVSTSVLLAGYVGIYGSTTTIATVDVDYLLIKAKRDWAR